jgi:hypothetical protein
MIQGVIECPRRLTAEQAAEVRRQFEAAVLSKDGKVILLQNGMRYVPLGKFWVYYWVDIDVFGFEEFDTLDEALAFRDEKMTSGWINPYVKIIRGTDLGPLS